MIDPFTRAIWFMWSLFYLIWMGWAFQGVKKTVQKESLSSMVGQRVVLFTGFFFLFFPISWVPFGVRLLPPSVWLDWASVTICLLGLGFSLWARLALGGNWSGIVTLKKGHQLIRIGPYALTRNPIYTGLLTASLGATLNANQVGALLGLVLIFVAYHMKMTVEESFMRKRFGKTYTLYSREVKKLIPWVY